MRTRTRRLPARAAPRSFLTSMYNTGQQHNNSPHAQHIQLAIQEMAQQLALPPAHGPSGENLMDFIEEQDGPAAAQPPQPPLERPELTTAALDCMAREFLHSLDANTSLLQQAAALLAAKAPAGAVARVSLMPLRCAPPYH